MASRRKRRETNCSLLCPISFFRNTENFIHNELDLSHKPDKISLKAVLETDISEPDPQIKKSLSQKSLTQKNSDRRKIKEMSYIQDVMLKKNGYSICG